MKQTSLLAFALLFLLTTASFADDAIIKNRADAEALISTFKYQKGQIPLKGDLAVLNVPDSFRYLGPDDAESILVRLWRNPPGPKTLGLLIPADLSPIDPNCWVVTIDYNEDGHVKDDDAAKIDYTSLLAQMQKDTAATNQQRTSQGYSTVSLVGWAAPPRYDAQSHKLYWAKEIAFSDTPNNTLNYNIRVLGRKGVLLLNVIAPMSKLPQIESAAPNIISMVDFQKGNRYADFDSSTDKIATYGLAALVAGGIIAKTGLLKVILVGLLAAKKFIIIGFAAVSAWFKKIFKKKPKPYAIQPASPEAPPNQ
jgi:uncharacterized membrane-anchored protein